MLPTKLQIFRPLPIPIQRFLDLGPSSIGREAIVLIPCIFRIEQVGLPFKIVVRAMHVSMLIPKVIGRIGGVGGEDIDFPRISNESGGMVGLFADCSEESGDQAEDDEFGKLYQYRSSLKSHESIKNSLS